MDFTGADLKGANLYGAKLADTNMTRADLTGANLNLSWLIHASREMPWGTMGVNLSGSFLIGFFGTLTLANGRYPASEPIRLFVMVGFCGGYTTFSSFSLQTLDLLRGGAMMRAAANICVSVAFCICAVAVGHLLASHLNKGTSRIAQMAIEEEG